MATLSKKNSRGNTELEALKLLRNQANECADAYDSGRLDLQDAVDSVQSFAFGRGIIDILGQDRVQEVLAHAFRRGTRR